MKNTGVSSFCTIQLRRIVHSDLVSLIVLFLPLLLFTSSASVTGSNMSGKTLDIKTQITRSLERLARYESHVSFMTQCIQQQIIPKGMRLKFGSSALPNVHFLHEHIKTTLSAASADILHTCRDSYQSLVNKERLLLDEKMYDFFQTSDFFTIESVLRFKYHQACAKRRYYAKRKQRKIAKLVQERDFQSHSPSRSTPPPSTDNKRRSRRFRKSRKSTTDPHSGGDTDFVINLSDCQLTEDQVSVLSLGPKFCPTPQSLDHNKLSEDITEGCRKVRLKEYFYNPDTPTDSQPPVPKFFKPTGYLPPKGRVKELDIFCDTLQSRVENFKPNKPKHSNLSQSQKKAVQELRQLVIDRSIRISVADKGGKVVVQNTEDYIREAKRMLSNEAHYKTVAKNPTVQIAKESNNIVQELHAMNHIDDNTHNGQSLILKQSEHPPFTTFRRYINPYNSPLADL